MLIALAMIAQTLTLDPDPAKAAISCASSVRDAIDHGDSRMQAGAAVTYFLIQVARRMPGDASMLEKMSQVPQALAGAGPLSAETAKILMPQCDARFPAARRDSPVALPRDPFERDVTCYLLLALVMGTADGIRADTGDSTEYDRFLPPERAYRDRVDRTRVAHGFRTEAEMSGFASHLIEATLDVGNPLAFARSCKAALPA